MSATGLMLVTALLAPATVQPGVQVRPRGEATVAGDHLKGTATGSDHIVTQRTRAWLNFAAEELEARFAVQDVRRWGSEDDTLGDFSAEGLDVHEGWFQLGTGEWWVRAGRQEIALDGQRLIGPVDWTQQGRAFDALRFGHTTDKMDATFFAARVPDGDARDLFVGHAAFEMDAMRLAVPLILETNRMVHEEDRALQEDADRFTGGVHVKSTTGDLQWRAEAYVQAGKTKGASGAKDVEHLAYMAGVRAGYKVSPALTPTLWVDFLSGDDDHADEKTKTFDTLFATNHKFYGYFDRFLNIPVHTAGGGLVDIALKNSGKVGPGTLHVAVHDFMLASEDANERSGQVAIEIDLIYAVQLVAGAKLVGGFSAFLPQGDFKETVVDDEGDEMSVVDWTFLMLDVQLEAAGG